MNALSQDIIIVCLVVLFAIAIYDDFFKKD